MITECQPDADESTRRKAAPCITSAYDPPRSVASSWTGLTDGDLLFQACHLVSQMPLVPLEVFGSPIQWSSDMNLTDSKQDDRIRTALRNADKQGRLSVVAAVIGIAGGEKELRKIMNSTGELSIMDRGMLWIHLN